MSESDKRWMEGRTRPVRVYLTEEEHALVRSAAALADRSVSRFAVESIVQEAKRITERGVVPAPESKKPPRQRRKKT
jgi:uncharacterized protein (DUF1778 family)